MREITTHVANPVNDKLKIVLDDEPGAGGAHHKYRVVGFGSGLGTTHHVYEHEDCNIHFQNGPINEAGVNGLTHEVLLAIVIDRLECFQKGPYACTENAVAMHHCNVALEALKNRTRWRMARGVEGTMKV